MKQNTTRLINAATLCLLVTFLTACSSQSMQAFGIKNSVVNVDAENILPPEVSDMLTSTPQDISILISSGSMQGKTLMVGPTYFAASGRVCRKANISESLLAERYVACQAESGHWILTQSAI